VVWIKLPFNMENFGFNEVFGIPVTFDEKITDKTKWFALRTMDEGENYYIFLAGFDLCKNGKWVSTILRDKHDFPIEFDSMKDVVEAVVSWHKINPDKCFRDNIKKCVAIRIYDDTPEPWND